jgi:hypothetical protein
MAKRPICPAGQLYCSSCKRCLPVDAFTPSRRKSTGYPCQKCRKQFDAQRYRTPEWRFSEARRRAKQKGREWNLSLEDYKTLINQPCRYCEKSLQGDTGIGLDRMDNVEGYSRGNVVPCCGLRNEIKGDHLTYEEVMKLAPTLKLLRLERDKKGIRWLPTLIDHAPGNKGAR